MNADLKPIYCLADSQLLFWRDPVRDAPWITSLREHLPDPPYGGPRAAYLGASNGDDPAFYSIFSAAMDTLGIDDHRMIPSSFPPEDREYLASAHLVLLAGGDPLVGWRIFEQSGMREVITKRYFEGAVLVGISAGAVQLGWGTFDDPADGAEREARRRIALTFRLVPALVGAHEEEDDWQRLSALVGASDLAVRGLGIPSGGGLVYHPEGTVEPVRRPVQEIVLAEEEIRRSLLFPAGAEGEPTDSEVAAVH